MKNCKNCRYRNDFYCYVDVAEVEKPGAIKGGVNRLTEYHVLVEKPGWCPFYKD